MKTFILETPIKFGSETISEMTIQEPKARDLRKFPNSPTTNDILDLASRLTGQPPQAIDELSVPDALRLCEQVGNFFQSSATGGMR